MQEEEFEFYPRVEEGDEGARRCRHFAKEYTITRMHSFREGTHKKSTWGAEKIASEGQNELGRAVMLRRDKDERPKHSSRYDETRSCVCTCLEGGGLGGPDGCR